MLIVPDFTFSIINFYVCHLLIYVNQFKLSTSTYVLFHNGICYKIYE